MALLLRMDPTFSITELRASLRENEGRELTEKANAREKERGTRGGREGGVLGVRWRKGGEEKKEEEEVGSHASLLALFSQSEVFP